MMSPKSHDQKSHTEAKRVLIRPPSRHMVRECWLSDRSKQYNDTTCRTSPIHRSKLYELRQIPCRVKTPSLVIIIMFVSLLIGSAWDNYRHLMRNNAWNTYSSDSDTSEYNIRKTMVPLPLDCRMMSLFVNAYAAENERQLTNGDKLEHYTQKTKYLVKEEKEDAYDEIQDFSNNNDEIKSNSVTVTDEKPDSDKKTDIVNIPVIVKKTETIKKPDSDKKTDIVNIPVIVKKTETIKKPDSDKKTDIVNIPVIVKKTETIKKPDSDKKTDKVNIPVVVKKTETIKKPDSDKKTDIVNIPVVVKKTETIKKPDIVNNPVIVKKTETIKKPDSDKKPDIVNNPVIVKKTETIKKPNSDQSTRWNEYTPSSDDLQQKGVLVMYMNMLYGTAGLLLMLIIVKGVHVSNIVDRDTFLRCVEEKRNQGRCWAVIYSGIVVVVAKLFSFLVFLINTIIWMCEVFCVYCRKRTKISQTNTNYDPNMDPPRITIPESGNDNDSHWSNENGFTDDDDYEMKPLCNNNKVAGTKNLNDAEPMRKTLKNVAHKPMALSLGGLKAKSPKSKTPSEVENKF